MPQRMRFKDSRVRFSLWGSVDIYCGGLPAPPPYQVVISVGEADLALLRSVKSSAALDFFRYHPITGLCSDCPVELRESLAQMSEKSNRLKPLVRVKGFDFTRDEFMARSATSPPPAGEFKGIGLFSVGGADLATLRVVKTSADEIIPRLKDVGFTS